LNNAFIVAPEPEGDNVQPFQCTLFRLEKPRDEVTFADSTCLSKDDCKNILEDRLIALTSCDIVGVEFPFFDQSEIKQGTFKYRPFVALFGESGVSALYLAVYMGAFRDNSNSLHDVELYLLKAPGDLQPPSAPDSLVDCSKICGFPNSYNRLDSRLHGEATWQRFRVDLNGSKHALSNRLSASNSVALREAVVAELVQLLVDDPIIDYVDTTLEYDIGTMIEYREKDDNGEWCQFRVRYEGPVQYSV